MTEITEENQHRQDILDSDEEKNISAQAIERREPLSRFGSRDLAKQSSVSRLDHAQESAPGLTVPEGEQPAACLAIAQMSSSRPLAVREKPEPLKRLEEESQTPEDLKDEKELNTLRNVMIFVGALFVLMGLAVATSLLQSVDLEKFVEPHIDNYHIASLSEFIVVEG